MINSKAIFDTSRILQISLIGIFLAYSYTIFIGSSIGTYLIMNTSVQEDTIIRVEKIIAVIILFLLIAIIWRISLIPVMLLFIFLITYAVIEFKNGGKPLGNWSFIASISRAFFPLLVFWYFQLEKKWTKLLFVSWQWVVRLSIGAIFLSHGIAALKLHPVYIDYIIGFVSNISGVYPAQQSTESFLFAVGILDLIAAVGVLLYPKKPVLIWILIWGFWTAILRIMDAGLPNIVEFLIRLPHFILPLILLRNSADRNNLT